MAYTKSPRNYKNEYATYQGTEEQKKHRAERNKARRQAIREGKAHKGDGMDVAHVKAIDKGGSIKNGVEIVTRPACVKTHKEKLQTFYNTVKVKAHSNTGMHVHVDKSKLSIYQIGFIYECG